MFGLNLALCVLLATVVYAARVEFARDRVPIPIGDVPSQQQVEIDPKQSQQSWLSWWLWQYLNSLGNQRPTRPPLEAPEPQPADQQAQDSGFCTCGTRSTNRIVGGEDAPQNKWCWQSQLITWANAQKTSYYLCGGSVICDRYVLTAAHCVEEALGDVSKMDVFLGAYKSYRDSNAIKYSVEKITPHPSYNTRTKDNDVALLKLTQKVYYSDAICPACLPSVVRDYTGKDAWVTGWGNTKENGTSASVLQQVKVQIDRKDYCEKQYERTLNKTICASAPGKDSCQGDSGGPLVAMSGTNYDLIGVVSSGYGCAREGYPGLYARVDSFLNWIYDNTADCAYCSRPVAG